MERTVWEHCFEWRVVTKVQTYLTRFCVFPLHCNVLNLIHVELLYLLVAIKWVAIIFTFPVGILENTTQPFCICYVKVLHIRKEISYLFEIRQYYFFNRFYHVFKYVQEFLGMQIYSFMFISKIFFTPAKST